MKMGDPIVVVCMRMRCGVRGGRGFLLEFVHRLCVYVELRD